MKRFIYTNYFCSPMGEDHNVLNNYGKQGWELVSTYAVRDNWNQVVVAYVFKKELEDESKDNNTEQ